MRIARVLALSAILSVSLGSFAQNLISGDKGEIYLASPPAGNAGVFLNAKVSDMPSISARLAGADTAASFQVLTPSNSSLFMVRGDGRVGVGTTSPTSKLTAASNSSFVSGQTPGADVALQGYVSQNVAAGVTNTSYVAAGHFSGVNSGSGTLNESYGLRVFSGNYGSSSGIVTTAYGARLAVTAGLGTITTGYGVFIEDVPATTQYGLYQAGTNDDNYFGGDLGIGVLPGTGMKLDVRGTAASIGTARRVARFWDDTAMSEGVGGGIDFMGKYHIDGSSTHFANVKGVKATDTSGDTDGHLVISVNDSGQMFEVVRIARNQMTVTGGASFTGTVTGANIAAAYQDVAEWVPTTQELAAGTVVVLDAKTPNHVVASTRSYDTTVAGVVSAQPGLILGVAGPSKAMVATTGRVRVRVDATAAPIAIGDLLVTGDKPGVAMKSKPIEFGGIAMHRPGTIVGKALEALEGGEGEILVLLSLQ